MPTTRPAGAPRDEGELRQDAARNRSLILDEARRSLAEGDTDLALNALARRVGVGVATVYRHFPDRQTLLEACAESSFVSLLDAVESAAADPDAAAAVRQVLQRGLDEIIANRALELVLRADGCVLQSTSAALRALMQTFRGLLQRARAEGVVRADVTPDDLRRYLLALVSAADLAGSRSSGTRKRARRDLQILLDGLMTRG